jgi:glycosyltransferase involved in cell wall biosynthesis
MNKIVHLITSLGLGGAENQLCQLVMHSNSTRFKHIVISMQDLGQHGSQLQQQGITVYCLNMRRSSVSIPGFFRLAKILQNEKPDILQTWLYHADLLGLLVGKFLGFQKIIWNIRCSDMQLKHYSRLTSLVIRLCSALSFLPKAVIVNSHAGQKAHQSLGYRVKNWINIPNGFKTEYFKPDLVTRSTMRESLGVHKNTLLIAMIARFDPMKDHASFLVAAKSLLRKFKDIQLLLVGAGLDNSNETLIKQITSLDLSAHIHLLGPQRDMPKILSALDLLVLPSAFGEGFPNILGEAMACGIPCVATNVGDSAIIIGDTGAIAKPSDSGNLAMAMAEILQLDKIERQRLGALARQRIIDHYHFPKIIQQYEITYEKLCAE